MSVSFKLEYLSGGYGFLPLFNALGVDAEGTRFVAALAGLSEALRAGLREALRQGTL